MIIAESILNENILKLIDIYILIDSKFFNNKFKL